MDKSLLYILTEGKKDQQASIAFELEAEGLEEGVEYKFDNGNLFARDQDEARKVSDALAMWTVTIGDKRKSDGFIPVSKLNSLYSPQDFIDLNTSENGDSKNMTIKLSHGKELLFEMNESRITTQETTNSIIDNESSALFSDESDKLFNESVTRIFEQLNICQEK